MSDFNALKFVADNAGLNIFKALEKAYEQGKADAASKWIPVSERLPEEGQRCLVCDNGWFSIDTFVGHGNPYNWKLYVRDYEAWMPLPEPWKGE